MTVVHQKPDAMLFGLNGKRLGEVNNLESGHLYFIPTRSPRLRTRHAGDRQGGFLSQVIREAESFLPQRPFAQNGLDIPGPVPKREKLQFAARSMMADPPLKAHLPPHHFSNMSDGHDRDAHAGICAFIKKWNDTISPVRTASGLRGCSGKRVPQTPIDTGSPPRLS